MAAPDNVLSSAYLSRVMLASLPQQESPQLTHSIDALALAANACMTAVDFRLVGLGETQQLDAPSSAEGPQPLPKNWNVQKEHYSFRYKHPQSSLEFNLKVLSMGRSAVIIGKAVEHDQSFSVDIKLEDYISAGNLPWSSRNQLSSEGESTSESTSPEQKRLEQVFINEGRLSDFGSLMKVKIIQKLTPSLQKPGYEESREANTNTSSTSSRTEASGRESGREDVHNPPRYEPLREDFQPLATARIPPHRLPRPGTRGELETIPGFDDEHELLPRPGGHYPAFNPAPRGIGYDDLYPAGLGPDEFIGGGGGRRGGPPGFGEPSGMYPSLPGFGPRDPRGFDGQRPPGSRWDPMGPRGPWPGSGPGSGPSGGGGFGFNDII